MKLEKELRADLTELLRQSLRASVVFRHEDIRIAGIPDISVNWRGYTTWIETKIADPYPKSRGIQHTNAIRLSTASKCVYVVWQTDKDGQERTYIATPQELFNLSSVPDERVSSGFDHRIVVDFIRRTHNDNNGT